MLRKKLKFMNVKEEEILTREEMKHIMAGSSGSDCNCGTGSECGDWPGCSKAVEYFNCLMAACAADCNPPSCSYDCTAEVGSSWQLMIGVCGSNYG